MPIWRRSVGQFTRTAQWQKQRCGMMQMMPASAKVAAKQASLPYRPEALLSDTTYKPIGRTLDFLTQEMLREANTIASKCGDAEISRSIVEVKGSIDRIKEQVQNVE